MMSIIQELFLIFGIVMCATIIGSAIGYFNPVKPIYNYYFFYDGINYNVTNIYSFNTDFCLIEIKINSKIILEYSPFFSNDQENAQNYSKILDNSPLKQCRYLP